MNLNTVLAPVYWELIEPAEGKFDWTSLDTMLRDARAHDLKLVLLWFGAWKNSMSTYVPSWVKRDQTRFPRVAGRRRLERRDPLGVFRQATRAADVTRLRRADRSTSREVDARDSTVLMIQVENEIGMLPIARERGAIADQVARCRGAGRVDARARAARHELEPELRERWQAHGTKSSGSWAQVFGEDEWGQEVFTAWHYARFVEALVKAGKAHYDLPMYVNVRAEPHWPQARRVSERRTAAASAGRVEGRRAVARLHRARHLLPELRAARRALPARGQHAVHSRGQQRHQPTKRRECVLRLRRAGFAGLLAVLGRITG